MPEIDLDKLAAVLRDVFLDSLSARGGSPENFRFDAAAEEVVERLNGGPGGALDRPPGVIGYRVHWTQADSGLPGSGDVWPDRETAEWIVGTLERSGYCTNVEIKPLRGTPA